MRVQEVKCYFDTGDWTPERNEAGNECMKEWSRNNNAYYYYAEINGLMLSSFSEYLAFLPYLLRSLRIKLMFKATDTYVKTDKMPKR